MCIQVHSSILISVARQRMVLKNYQRKSLIVVFYYIIGVHLFCTDIYDSFQSYPRLSCCSPQSWITQPGSTCTGRLYYDDGYHSPGYSANLGCRGVGKFATSFYIDAFTYIWEVDYLKLHETDELMMTIECNNKLGNQFSSETLYTELVNEWVAFEGTFTSRFTNNLCTVTFETNSNPNNRGSVIDNFFFVSIDWDSDGWLDCDDLCPFDPLKSIYNAGDCGCGVPNIDSDCDGIYDCNDSCPGSDNNVPNSNAPFCLQSNMPANFNSIPNSWKCGVNQVYFQRIVNSTTEEVCVNFDAISMTNEYNKGFFMGRHNDACYKPSTPSSSPSLTSSISLSSTPSSSISITRTSSSSKSLSPSISISGSQSSSISLTISLSPTISLSNTKSISQSRTHSPSKTSYPSKSAVPSNSAAPSATPTRTGSVTPSLSVTSSISITPSISISATSSISTSPSATRSISITPNPSSSPSISKSPTISTTPSVSYYAYYYWYNGHWIGH